MDASLLYRPAQRWHIGAAFCAAALLHIAAVAVAERRDAAPLAISPSDEAVEIDIAPGVDEQQEIKPVEDEIPPLITPTEDEFAAEEEVKPRVHTTPPTRPRQPLVRPHAQQGLATNAKLLAVRAPRPEYPYEARRQRLTGSGVAMLTVDVATGAVTGATMSRSTGSAVLDSAALSAFRQWRFRPGTVTRVQTPVTFTLAGATY